MFSEWAGLIIPVLKKDGTVQICNDYKLTVNQAAKVNSYPFPKINDLFASLARGQTFSNLIWLVHTFKFYWMKPHRKCWRSILIKAYTNAKYFHLEYLQLLLLSKEQWKQFFKVYQGSVFILYLDDLLITGNSDEEHLVKLSAVLSRLATASMKLKSDKCSYLLQEVEYLGPKISTKGLKLTT